MSSPNIKISYFLFLSLLLVWFKPALLHAQTDTRLYTLDTARLLNQYIKDRWTQENGLPNNSVKDICKDTAGYLWLATYNGLVRFDGTRIKVFTQRNSQLGTNSLVSVAIDAKGTLWVGTNGSGLYYKKDESFYRLEGIPASATITAMLPDPYDERLMWIGTRNGLYCLREGVSVHYTGQETLMDENIFALEKQKQGILWVGTQNKGLWRISKRRTTHFTKANGLPHLAIRTLAFGPNQELYIGTGNGLAVYKDDQIQQVDLEGHQSDLLINDIAIDPFQNLWLATDDGLFRKSVNGSVTFIEVSEQKSGQENLSAVEKLFFDQQGSLWLATYENGLLRLKDGKFNSYTALQALPNSTINVAYPEADSIWLGTNEGLALIKAKQVSLPIKESNQKNLRIRDILRSREGRLYLATYDGLYTYSRQQELILVKDTRNLNVRRIKEGKDGSIWLGCKEGVYILKGNTLLPFHQNTLSQVYIMDIHFASDSSIWVATNGEGVYRFSNQKMQHFQVEDGLASNVVFRIFVDSHNKLWLTTNNGISVKQGAKFKSLCEKNGFVANTVFQILEDKHGNFWFTTNQGIVYTPRLAVLGMIERKDAVLSPYKLFTKSDGLAHTQITASSISALDRQGHLWFTTIQGVSSIDPAQIPVNFQPPKVLIEEIVADGKVLKESDGQQYILPAGTQHLQIAYTAFSYYDPEHTTFRYRLNGFDRDWQEAGSRRKAYYTNLPPGEYSFEVQAFNEDGIASLMYSSSPFVQNPFFFDQKWVRYGGLSFLILLFIAGYQWHTSNLKRQNEKLSQMVDQRTQQIREQNEHLHHYAKEQARLNNLKDKLLSIISHDLRGPLTSALGLLNLVNSRQISQEEFSELADDLSEYINQQVNMLDNLLHWSHNQLKGDEYKPELISFYDTVENILALYATESNRKHIRLINQVPQQQQVLADVDMVSLVLRNLITNAIKFTSEAGIVVVSVQNKESHVLVEVADNGVGMNRDQLARIFKTNKLTSTHGTLNEKGTGLGLSICKEFVERWGGKIWAESYPGKGSKFKFTLSLPLSEQTYLAHSHSIQD